MKGLWFRVYGLGSDGIRIWLILFTIHFTLFTSLTSCQREHLYYESSDKVTVTLSIDWMSIGMSPNGATVYAYNADGSLYKRFPPFSNPAQGTIELPKGTYSLVVMNDTPEELYETMTISGEERKETLLAEGVMDEAKTRKLQSSRSTEDYCIKYPEDLAVAVIEGITIDEQTMYYTYDKPSGAQNVSYSSVVKVEPRLVTTKAKIKAHVQGLSYSKGTTMTYLRGTSCGYYMGLGKYSEQTASYGFILNNRTFDPGSTTDGTITAEFSCWGLPSETAGVTANYRLEANFVMIDGTENPISMDITDQVNVNIDLQMQLNLDLDLEIELPETKPDGSEGGFNTELNAWSEVIQNIEM